MFAFARGLNAASVSGTLPFCYPREITGNADDGGKGRNSALTEQRTVNMHFYSCFADFYDSLTQNVQYPERADYLLRLFERHDHRPGLTLDLACGTGSLTIELKKRGLDIFGADASEEMLTLAQQKACDADLEILFLHQHMQRLRLFGPVDTCICTLDSINHLNTEQDVVRTFCAVEKHLADDGLFVFDANTVFKHREILGENCFILENDQVFCAWQNRYSEKGNRVLITLDFFVPSGKHYERCSEQFPEYAYTREKTEEMLSRAGLRIEAVYDDMSFDEPTETTQREIYVIRKEKYESR